MFPQMRRRKQELSPEEAGDLLRSETYGILALSGDDGAYPYAVPLNHVYLQTGLDGTAPLGALYFHCALEGHKIELMERNPKASFCVVGKHEVLPENFSTSYQSTIAFGPLRILDEPAKDEALYQLSKRFDPEAHETILAEIEKVGSRCLVLELAIEHLSGKVSRDLMKTSSR